MAVHITYHDGSTDTVPAASQFDMVMAERKFKKPLQELAQFLECRLWLSWKILSRRKASIPKFEKWLTQIADLKDEADEGPLGAPSEKTESADTGQGSFT